MKDLPIVYLKKKVNFKQKIKKHKVYMTRDGKDTTNLPFQ